MLTDVHTYMSGGEEVSWTRKEDEEMKQEVHHLPLSWHLSGSGDWPVVWEHDVFMCEPTQGACFPVDGAAETTLTNKLLRWAGDGSVCRW